MGQVVGRCDILFICLDTLRYDVAAQQEAAGETPVLNLQNQHLRLHGQHTGNRRPPLLAARQFKGGTVPIFLQKPYLPQRRKSTQLGILFRKPLVLRPKADIRKYRGLEKLVFWVLKDQPYFSPQRLAVIIGIVDILPLEIDAARGRPQQAVQMLD